MKTSTKVLIGAGLAFGAYWLWRKYGGAGGVANAAAQGAVNAAAGAVKGVASAFGIPDTNVQKGMQDVAAGNWWDASFDLPAPLFFNEAGSAIGSGFYDLTHPGQ